MKRSNYSNQPVINPVEQEEVRFWTKKWGISPRQLNEAILETGSIRAQELKNYLVNKGLLFSSNPPVISFRALFRRIDWK